MAFTEHATGNSTVSTTEYSLVNDSTSIATETEDGVYQLWVDPTAMQAGDTYEIAVQEKVESTGSQLRRVLATLSGAQTEAWVQSDPDGLQLMHGWDFTLKRTAGVDRAMGWSIRRIA